MLQKIGRWSLLAAGVLLMSDASRAEAQPVEEFRGEFRAVGGGFGFGGRGVSISSTTINGVTTINAQEDGQTVRITRDPNVGIKVEVVKTYDKSNADELKETNPAVFNYIEKAPVGMGATQINVKVEISDVVEAKDEEELKKDFPEAHALYEKYSQGGNRIRIDFGGGIPGALPPAFAPPRLPDGRDFPRGIEIGPDGGIRIAPPKKEEPKEEQEDKPAPMPPGVDA